LSRDEDTLFWFFIGIAMAPYLGWILAAVVCVVVDMWYFGYTAGFISSTASSLPRLIALAGVYTFVLPLIYRALGKPYQASKMFRILTYADIVIGFLIIRYTIVTRMNLPGMTWDAIKWVWYLAPDVPLLLAIAFGAVQLVAILLLGSLLVAFPLWSIAAYCGLQFSIWKLLTRQRAAPVVGAPAAANALPSVSLPVTSRPSSRTFKPPSGQVKEPPSGKVQSSLFVEEYRGIEQFLRSLCTSRLELERHGKSTPPLSEIVSYLRSVDLLAGDVAEQIIDLIGVDTRVQIYKASYVDLCELETARSVRHHLESLPGSV